MSDQNPATPSTPEPEPGQQATPEPGQPAGGAPTAPADDPNAVVVMQEPGGSMTSTGETIVENDLSDDEFEAALEGTIKAMDNGSLIEGVVVKIDPDEVLLDIGWKSEGVIPIRELSIKMDIDPHEVVHDRWPPGAGPIGLTASR